MKKGLIVFICLILFVWVMAFTQDAATDNPGFSVVYGGRLQSDQLFYAQLGVKSDTADVMLGIGWNNSIWLGGHAYFFSGDGIAAFSGIELHIEYPTNGTIELHPALPLGFAVTQGKAAWIVEALILPSPEGEQIQSIFALSFLFKL